MTEIDSKSRNRARLAFIGLVMIFVVPIIAAIVLHSIGGGVGTAHTVNHGELVRPVVPLGEHTFTRVDGQVLPADYFKGNWTMVYMDSAECDKACEDNLVMLRQSRLALGGEKERVHRLMVLTDGKPAEGLTVLLEQHPGMDVVNSDDVQKFIDIFKATGDDNVTQRIYIVDPLGNLMMRYPREVEPKGIIKDMERLLKYSKVG